MDFKYYVLNFSWLIDNRLAGHRGPQSIEQLELLWDSGIRALVRMTQIPRVKAHDIKKVGFQDYHLKIPDMTAPSQEKMCEMVGFIHDRLSAGRPVGVSCDGGIGRTATLLSCYLISTGLSAADSIAEVKARRPGSVLTDEQQQAVREFARGCKR